MPALQAIASPSTLRDKAQLRAAGHLGISPDQIEDDLLDFLSADSGDVLLRARAGSGKTTALTIKASVLTQDLGVDPSTIMMLTFNNAAARSLEARLEQLGVPAGVRVRTFHALGQRIVRAHLGNYRRAVFDENSEDGRAIAEMMQEALDEVTNERFYHYCASKMRTSFSKRKDYVESVGRDALLSAVNFLRARGYGIQNRLEDAWDIGPIAGNAMKVVLSFENRLRDAGLLDATAVLQAASWTLEREISTGAFKESDAHGVDWIFIDEFQDVSLPYMRLVAAMRDLNGGFNLQGVGDDWQAINGFAGADLDYFSNVEKHLVRPVRMDLLKNRRSGSSIVAWGNEVMTRAGYPDGPAVPSPEKGQGVVSRCKISASRDIFVAADRLADLIEPDMDSVALIARKWKVGDYALSRFRDLVQKAARAKGYTGNIISITAHGSKGLEYDQVLLLDDGSFPMQHPSRPILEALIPETDYLREEACLLHVAGTRARKRLDVVSMA